MAYRLIKKFPGMREPLGTLFLKEDGWNSLGTLNGHHSTEWIEEEYFKPYVGEFFENTNLQKEKCDHDYEHVSQGIHRPVYCSNCREEL